MFRSFENKFCITEFCGASKRARYKLSVSPPRRQIILTQRTELGEERLSAAPRAKSPERCLKCTSSFLPKGFFATLPDAACKERAVYSCRRCPTGARQGMNFDRERRKDLVWVVSTGKGGRLSSLICTSAQQQTLQLPTHPAPQPRKQVRGWSLLCRSSSDIMQRYHPYNHGLG